jgi:acyl CoA:acetate/3-ketoacid CoA transferase beta subunit
VGSFCHRTIIVMRQDDRKFVERVEFITTPGYLTGPGARERAGLPRGSGPFRVITQLGLYGFDDETKELQLIALHPRVTLAEVRAQSGYPVRILEPVRYTEPPSAEDRRILREIDPSGLVIRR